MVGIRQRDQRAQARHRLLEQFHSLARDLERQEGDAGQVSAGPRQTLCKAGLNGIAAYGEENWDVLDRPCRTDRREARDDQGNV
jgi:hypothetical protein